MKKVIVNKHGRFSDVPMWMVSNLALNCAVPVVTSYSTVGTRDARGIRDWGLGWGVPSLKKLFKIFCESWE